MTLAIPSLPPLDWTGVPGKATFDESTGTLALTAAAGVDWTNSSLGGPQQQAATALAFDAPAEFSLSARVAVTAPRSTFDAGALAIWIDADHWAKVCFEFSPQGRAMVVTVVTNEFSDDCNSFDVAGDSVFLRVTRTSGAWVFHASANGTAWDFVRVFRLASTGTARVGFLAQAPLGQTCEAQFSRITLSHEVPGDLRDGS